MSEARRIAVIVAWSAALLGSLAAASAQPASAAGAGAHWAGTGGWPIHDPYGPYGPYGPYPWGGYARWGPCIAGPCLDSIEVRRAVRRELQRQELRRELELGSGGGYGPGAQTVYGPRRDAPPPTPESELQPRYRGSGEIRPEYRDAGKSR